MKAYLDNNVVSAIARDDTATESDALDRLLVAKEQGKVDLVTSDLSLEEIKKYVGPGRKMTERTFRMLEKVAVVPWDKLLGIHSYNDAYTSINSPMIENDPPDQNAHATRDTRSIAGLMRVSVHFRCYFPFRSHADAQIDAA